MKKLILLIVPLFFACQKEPSVQSGSIKNKSETTLNPSEFDYIGIRHNSILDSIYHSLASNSANFTLAQALNKSKQITDSEINYVTPLNADGEAYIGTRMNLVVDFFNDDNEHLPETGMYNEEMESSAELKSLLDDLNQVYLDIEDNGNLPLQDVLQDIYSLENHAADILTSDSELFIFYIYSRISVHSLSYWHENLTKWETSFGGNNKVSGPYGISWGNAAKSDAVSAGVGAVHLAVSGTGAAMLAGGPAGWVGIGAVVVAEGIIGSASSILVDLW